ncbi:MAG: imidazolonepropionase [Phycisphaerales bacterium]|nr:imidazolonepropionase [Phycisphaerales bacterium]
MRPAATPQADSLLVTDIHTLAAVKPGPRRGSEMRDVPMLQGAAVLIRDGRIAWFGPQREAPLDEGLATLSASGGCVIPGLIDPHTHIPFAGDRSGEFVRRLAGESYLSILESGGGIRVTSEAVRAATVEDLVAENLPRLRRMLERGVTRVECKSGYGLAPEHEIKQLEAVRELAHSQPVGLVATYLGAHAVPAEFDGRPDAYLDEIGAEPLLRQVAAGGLARFADVFCDRGAFTVEQARRYLERAAAAGLKLKVHADELAQIGASALAGALRAVSADHLERIDDDGIAALRSAGTVAVVLPGTSFFLGIEHAPARRLIDAGLPVALATDYNPGSCMIESLPWIMAIACCQLRLHPCEVLTACTANAAAAIDEHTRAGAVAVGFDADLVMLEAPTVERWFYEPGRNQVRAVLRQGRVVYQRPER